MVRGHGLLHVGNQCIIKAQTDCVTPFFFLMFFSMMKSRVSVSSSHMECNKSRNPAVVYVSTEFSFLHSLLLRTLHVRVLHVECVLFL